jgi:dTDP-4-dehydrorhamnose reductase
VSHLLVTGATGFLGHACVRAALAAGHDVTALRRGATTTDETGFRWLQADLLDTEGLSRCVASARPDAVVHCAAMAVPRDCDADPEKARRVNVEATAALARCARVILVSTDLVLGGDRAPYDEDAPTRPLSTYGRTKAEAEERLLAAGPHHAVVRTSMLVGPSPRGDRGMEEQLVADLRRDGVLRLFTDVFRMPMAAVDLARVLVHLAGSSFRGTLHVAGPERLSRFQMGRVVVEALGLPRDRVLPALSRDDGRLRPLDTTLVLDRMRAVLPPAWWPRTLRQALEDHPLANQPS